MNDAAAQLPGLSFTRATRAQEAAPLRSDVAGFAGRTRRGPVAQRVRVEGWNDYLRWFGGLAADAYTPYGLRGYFENGGLVAHVVRVGDPAASDPPRLALAEVAAFSRFGAYRIEASSPGAWANRTRIRLRYRRDGASGNPELDMAIEAPGERPEYLGAMALGEAGEDGVDPLQRQVESRSQLVRMIALGAAPGPWLAESRRRDWQLILDGGSDGAAVDSAAYDMALTQLSDEPEVALMALPDLYRDLDDPPAAALLAELLVRLDASRDRMLLVDAPLDRTRNNGLASAQMLAWVDALRGQPHSLESRAAAAWHPWLNVPDPLGGAADPLKAVPPSGHLAGVISKLDRERGPHHTPANAPVADALDLAARLDNDELAQLNAAAVNLVVCSSGHGLQAWGGSTLARAPRRESAAAPAFAPENFIACRRLVHRLVRAIRRVAEPLVFDANGPELWLAFVRAVTAVLLEAWRGGALKGERAAEAFYVQCDARTNPPEEVDQGRCVCEIGVAPVAPMEFIVFRVALAGEGTLEVFES